MINFEIISDLHLDHFAGSGEEGLEFLDTLFKNPQAPTLLIAGDIGFQNDFYTSYFFTLLKRKYEKVICVLGNHDYWRYSLKAPEIWKSKYQKDNIFILEKEFIQIDGINIFGTTLWSKLDPLNVPIIYASLRDFKFIEEFSSDYQKYCKSYEESFSALENFCNKKNPSLILTHHAPLPSCSIKHNNSLLNSAFCNNLSNFINEHENILAWVYGHVHEKMNMQINNTQIIINNSFGYYWQNKRIFKLERIEV